MLLRYLPNLADDSSEVREFDFPPDDVARPDFKSKDEYRAWCTDRSTDHAFLSVWEGEDPERRVSKSNPPRWLRGLVAEYDHKQGVSPEALLETLRKQAPAGHQPRYLVTSFSKRYRLFWEFEEPIPCGDKTLMDKFLTALGLELRVRHLGLAGYEEKESQRSSQYFEVGWPWVEVSKDRLSAHWLRGLLAKQHLTIDASKEGPSIPMEPLREEARARNWTWPGGWEHFTVGSRGKRFWDPSADNETAVVVRETGCTCYTGDRPFMSWEAIFGTDFVRRFKTGQAGEAIRNVWWEAARNKYWFKNEDGSMCVRGKDDATLKLRSRGLSSRVEKGDTLSSVEQALLMIQEQARIDGVDTTAFYRTGDVNWRDGKCYLNHSTIKLTQPVDEQGEWGKGFPWLARYFENLLGTEHEQLDRYRHWLGHFYRSCLAGDPVRGLGLFLAGPADIGKTFHGTAVLGQLFGGKCDVGRFVNGEDEFTGIQFSYPVWTVDDAVATHDSKARARYSQVVKATIANDVKAMRAMYAEQQTVRWTGRLVITLNLDDKSLEMIPDRDFSMEEKVLILKAQHPGVGKGQWPTDNEVARELPYLAAYLRDMTIPETPNGVWDGGRFGVVGWSHPDVVARANSTQYIAHAEDLLEIFRKNWRPTEPGPRPKHWSGTPVELLRDLNDCGGTTTITSSVLKTSNMTGEAVNRMIRSGASWIRRCPQNARRVIIDLL